VKIDNQTHWSTKDIEKLIRRVAEDELQPGQLKHGVVKVRYSRKNGYTGLCYIGTMRRPRVRMQLNIPRKAVDPVAFAAVIAHELAHAKGYQHGIDMHNNRYGWREGWKQRYSYAQDFLICAKPEIKIAPEERREKRRQQTLVKAERMVKKWQTTSKRAQTMLKKWQTKLRGATNTAPNSQVMGVGV
jgi:predicted SprT family Zn-dependent metalloprotease